MATIAEIMGVLFARAALMATEGPTLPTVFPEEAETFEPPADGKYLAVRFFSNAHRWVGVEGAKVRQGLLQVNVIWPRNRGLLAPGAVAELVEAHFPVGMLDLGVKITAPASTASPITDDEEIMLPVTIPWVA